ncbi:uridine kinase [Mucilaginibacter lutimaris]|uniref:Uridine kinase n=1 Tax=Mucilaginibacter lutimaris TaxID=931629 RepID=A0ABW2ZE13_9SPHI
MNKPYVIGVAGGSGSGKTFFLKSFLEHFSDDEVCLVSQDDYYFPVGHTMTKEENKEYNFDLPSTIDHDHFENDIFKLLKGESFMKQEYTFNNPNATPKIMEIKPAPIIIVEGLFIMHFGKIKEVLDMTIFIEADEHIALQRRLKRDLEERGYSNEDAYYKWVNHVVPAYKEYLLPYRDMADKIVVNNTQVSADIIKITDEISQELRDKLLN